MTDLPSQSVKCQRKPNSQWSPWTEPQVGTFDNDLLRKLGFLTAEEADILSRCQAQRAA